jgi:hypothetical protein
MAKENDDRSLLEAALIGYRHQLAGLQTKIDELQRLIGGKTRPAAEPQKRHRISAAGRARIAAAQRKRWAAAKGEK